jgi:hypothetical protein
MKRTRPVTPNDAMLQFRFAYPHDALDLGMNRDEGVRIARRRWKRKRSKYLRRLHRRACAEDLGAVHDQA